MMHAKVLPSHQHPTPLCAQAKCRTRPRAWTGKWKYQFMVLRCLVQTSLANSPAAAHTALSSSTKPEFPFQDSSAGKAKEESGSNLNFNFNWAPQVGRAVGKCCAVPYQPADLLVCVCKHACVCVSMPVRSCPGAVHPQLPAILGRAVN